MVLRSTQVLFLSLFSLLLASCLTRGAPVRTNTPQELFVVFVHDGDENPPAEFRERVEEELSGRGFTVRVSSKIKPEDRLGWSLQLSRLKSEAGGRQLLMIHTSSKFFSQLEGRLRWTVKVLATSAKSSEASIESFSYPAILNFGHQLGKDALNAVAGSIAKRLGDIASNYSNNTSATGQAATMQSSSTAAAADSIYFVLLDRFSNGDPSNDDTIDLSDPQAFHGGDLRGLIEKLDYIKELGFRHVWISPVFKMRTEPFHGHGAFHGYWTDDLDKVEPRFGTEAELVELSEELKARGMGLILDVVLNHVAYDSPVVKEKPEWFHHKGTIEDWNDAKQLTDYEVHGLPDYAHENPEVRAKLIATSQDWLQKLAPSGFRLDAVKHVPLEFWAEYNQFLREASSVRLLGELYDGNANTLSKTLQEAGFDSLFDFPLHFAMVDVFCRDASLLQMAAVLSLDRIYPRAATQLVTFLDNHDLSRVLSACQDDEARVHSALQFLLSSRGIPSISYGTESALRGAKEPENRADMRFVDHALAETIRKGLRLRREWKSLSSGTRLVLAADKKLYSFLQVSEDELTLVTVNHGPGGQALAIPEVLRARNGHDLLGNGEVVLGDFLAPKGVSVVGLRGDFRALLETIKTPATRMVQFQPDTESATLDLRIVGAAPEFGAWDPAKAPSLAKAMSLPSSETYSYKLVAMRDGKASWQSGGNEYLFVPAGDSPMKVNVQWRE
ncbi:MAG: hypothetical protein JKY56_17955 [Kofleriaceae bacterium]|nr:hypothetical protein [Kofleriaceae bacterium]